MKPASYAEMSREVLLANGVGAGYALGLDTAIVSGRRALSHGGEVSGFTAHNVVFPDDGAAIAVLTNEDASGATGDLSERIVKLLFESRDGAATTEARARAILEGLQRGTLDRSLFTDDANAYFTADALRDFATGLGPLGSPTKVEQTAQRDRGGMIVPRLRRDVRLREGGDLGARHAEREDRAVPGDAQEVILCAEGALSSRGAPARSARSRGASRASGALKRQR